MKKLYCFDFDGTLTYKDTMFLFLNFYNSSKFKINFIKHTPLFLLLKLKLIEAEKVKKHFISSILKGEKKSEIERKSKLFFEQNYPDLIRENALSFIEKIDKKNTQQYIVTASLDFWVQPFADHFGMRLIATKAQFVDDVFTGNFEGRNCNGVEKVRRLKEEISASKYDKIIAFGDTSGDFAMMKWAHEGKYKFFH